MDFKEKGVFITGANGSLGRVFVEEFARNKANIIAHARKSTPEFLSFINDIKDKYKVSVFPIFFDMTDLDAMKSAVRSLVSSKTPINILVNNTGVAHGGLFQMTSMQTVRDVFNVNLFSQMELTQLLLRYMAKFGKGSIINISSITGLDLAAGNCAYGLSKASMIAFTKVLSKEAIALGIRVNAVAPGLTDTSMATKMEDKAREQMLGNSTMKRLAIPLEIANSVMFLASDEASFINGQVLRVDGGEVL